MRHNLLALTGSAFQDLSFSVHDLISEAILSQTRHIHMGPIRKN